MQQSAHDPGPTSQRAHDERPNVSVSAEQEASAESVANLTVDQRLVSKIDNDRRELFAFIRHARQLGDKSGDIEAGGYADKEIDKKLKALKTPCTPLSNSLTIVPLILMLQLDTEKVT